MYEFRDTIDGVLPEGSLPAEAMQINGIYLEKEIPGYRTIAVRGRELHEKDVRTTGVGTSDGTRFRSKRYGERILQIEYQLIANDNDAFRHAFNKLNRLLNVENAYLIFEDEADKFFIGTPEKIRDVEAGQNNVTGEFTIVCADPFKYSVLEHEIVPTLDGGSTFLVNYQGDFPAYPKLEARMNSDNGVLGFLNQRENILQFGNDEEDEDVIGVVGQMSEQLTNTITGGAFTQSPWIVGGTFHHRPSDYGTNGTFGTRNHLGRTWLRLATMGTSGSTARGAVTTFTLPPDRNGEVGAADWECEMLHLYFLERNNQTGVQHVTFFGDTLEGANRRICSFVIFKSGTGSTNARARWRQHDNSIIRDHQFVATNRNANPFREGRGNNKITKRGDTLRIFWNGAYETFRIPALGHTKLRSIQVHIGQYANRTFANMATRNYVGAIRLTKFNVDVHQPIPNQFLTGDEFQADTRSGEVLMQGMPAPGLGALGNEWEDFTLVPGVNQIRCAWSDWATSSPDFKLKYREVYL